MNDFWYEQYRKRADKLIALGYEIHVDADSYSVTYKGEYVISASVILPREKKLHWKHRQANIRDNLQCAVYAAEHHLAEMSK